jgi:hypothetical protein
LPAAHAGRAALGLGKRLGGRPAESVAAQVQARTAAQLFQTLGQLKGGAMKVGQALSAMEAALPAELAAPYRDALERLQEAAPPMPGDVVHQVLAEELGVGWRQRFRSFDDRPAAAASIGQVHRAVWNDGTTVAVKVQYPGAADALLADVRQLDRLVPLARLGAPSVDLPALFGHLRLRLADELDYEREAEAQRAFAAAFAGHQDYVVPRVVEVAPRVLVSEWLDGTPLSAVVRHGASDVRDRAGLLLLRLLLSAPDRLGRVHGDPHPGNFRIDDHGRLIVLDFGSSEPMAEGWPPRLGRLLRAGIHPRRSVAARRSGGRRVDRPRCRRTWCAAPHARPVARAAASATVPLRALVAAGRGPALVRSPRRRRPPPAQGPGPARAHARPTGRFRPARRADVPGRHGPRAGRGRTLDPRRHLSPNPRRRSGSPVVRRTHPEAGDFDVNTAASDDIVDLLRTQL